MVSPATLVRASNRARGWLMDDCFPLWASAGVDPRGGFRERLSLNGRPVQDSVSRVRVQARQTFLFSLAHLMGWSPARSAALTRRGAETLLGPCRRQDHLFGARIRPGGALTDRTADLYDNAFALMALAWAGAALKEPRYTAEADATLAALDAHMAHPRGGYREALGRSGKRQQNPHMHLLEALLSLHAVTCEPAYLARADKIVDLFRTRFYQRSQGVLAEDLDENWRPLAQDGASFRVEPGHHFEWVWLLERWAHAHGAEPPAEAAALYRFALRSVEPNGLAPLSTDPAGRPLDGRRRTWVATEALKAHLAMAAAGDRNALGRAVAAVDVLFETHLAGAARGGWRDMFDAKGRAYSEPMPASTGYHVALAFADLIWRVSQATGAPELQQGGAA